MSGEAGQTRMAAAVAAHQAGRLDEARDLYQQALDADPAQPDVMHRLGLVALAQGRLEEGVGHLRRTLGLDPSMAAAHFNLGLALQLLGRTSEALAVYDRGAILAPGSPLLHFGRAGLLMGVGRPGEALAAYDRAIALAPDHVEAWSNRGLALQALDRPEEAVESFDRALAVRPGFVDALMNRGVALRELNRMEASIASLRSAVDVDPDNAAAQANLGVVQLLAGDLGAGFGGHEHRWDIEPGLSQARSFTAPLWSGQDDLAGKTLLLHAEQGFGDTLQFCRYAPLAAARGARVVLEVQPALKTLMQSLDGVDELIASGEALPPFDLHCPLMSLPHVFRTTLETVPVRTAYLTAPPERVSAWAGAAAPSPSLKIGVAWFGKPTHQNDRNRSLRLDQLMQALPEDAEVFSLHDRVRAEDESALAANPRVRRFEDRLKDFADTAALASRMDLVVAVDTSLAHLAAAIGRPTWVLLPFSPDWRWLLGREDSPWYPTVRLFRQTAIGDWDRVMSELRQALAEAVRARAG